MRQGLLAASLMTLHLSPVEGQAPSNVWTRAVAPGQGTPAGAWAVGTWPMGAAPTPGPGNKLWMFADGWAWSSTDQT
ncbi:MAG TPA: hypothetical protein VJU15_15135, partial [Gemmatimonadales bacterium]|nr:hypothetical protein [Gemmatimonadales bacterium]